MIGFLIFSFLENLIIIIIIPKFLKKIQSVNTLNYIQQTLRTLKRKWNIWINWFSDELNDYQPNPILIGNGTVPSIIKHKTGAQIPSYDKLKIIFVLIHNVNHFFPTVFDNALLHKWKNWLSTPLLTLFKCLLVTILRMNPHLYCWNSVKWTLSAFPVKAGYLALNLQR